MSLSPSLENHFPPTLTLLSASPLTHRLNFQEPSGEIGQFSLQSPVRVGREPGFEVQLRDPTIPSGGIEIHPVEIQSRRTFWVRSMESGHSVVVGNLHMSQGEIPTDVPFYLGETRFEIILEDKYHSVPALPRNIKPWLTCSKSGRSLLWNIKKAAKSRLSIYLSGETGTGKEVLAHIIHHWSSVSSNPMITINCSALNPSLAESELFGHEKGAFTGAIRQKPGALLQAHTGTLFLDEIGDLSPDLQVKLLRFLENGEIRPVGGDQSFHANVRIVCASNKSLSDLVKEGKFRQDLYFRLASITLEIPPLRKRPEDIEFIARKFCSEQDRLLTPKAIQRLRSYSWPGNVRELRHAIERAISIGAENSKLLDDEAFDFIFESQLGVPEDRLRGLNGILTLHEMERAILLKALRLSEGNRTRAAQILGVARSTLFDMIKRHHIVGPRNSKASV